MLSRLLLHETPLLTSLAKTTAKLQVKCDKKQLKCDKNLQVHQQENDCIYSVFFSTMHQNHAVPISCVHTCFHVQARQKLLWKGADEAVASATSRTGKQNLHVFVFGRAADAAAAVVSAAATAEQQQQLLFNVAFITNHFGKHQWLQALLSDHSQT